jgi:cyclopropane fatty-acyl-phospholipid synthase-like methyltransferase
MPVLQQSQRSTVATCYSLLDTSVAGGIEDFSEGKYERGDGDDRQGYLQAQWRQAEFLLDQVRCRPGSRVLDIGCGNGRVLRQAVDRGADALGVTISREQVRRCRDRALDARLIDYRDLRPEIHGRFSGIIANGSLEHFVQPEDAAAGNADKIYSNFFRICRRMIRRGDRLVTTAIHFRARDQVSAEDVLAGSRVHRPGSAEYHFAAVLQDCFGGWYPAPRQLQLSASRYFVMESESDGTADYVRTSRFWLRHLKWSMATRPDVLMRLASNLSTRFMPTLRLLRCLLVDRSWNWQFQGDEPPTCLLRQTWRAI